MLSRNLEQTLHRALSLASERRHEYATLEHLLLGLADDTDAATVLRACGVDLDKLRTDLAEFLDKDLAGLATDRTGRSQAHRRLPARRPARRDPRPVLRPRRSDRRQRAGRPVLRARKPRRLFPAAPGHDPPRRGQLHQPRHRQGPRPHRRAPGPGRCRPAEPGLLARARARGKTLPPRPGRALQLLRQPQQEGAGRQDRPADRPRAPKSSAPSRSSAAAPRTTRSTWAIPASARPPSPRASPSASSRATCPRCSPNPPSSRSTWAPCWPAPATAAISRNA